jgi:hypothetical protein
MDGGGGKVKGMRIGLILLFGRAYFNTFTAVGKVIGGGIIVMCVLYC